MSFPINDGGPAFPAQLAFSPDGAAHIASEYYASGEGMSLRDWFAGQALAGWCAASPLVRKEPLNMTVGHAESIATGCYRYADAMLKARNQKGSASK